MEFGERTAKAATDTKHMGVACHTYTLISKCHGMSPKANVAMVGWDHVKREYFSLHKKQTRQLSGFLRAKLCHLHQTRDMLILGPVWQFIRLVKEI